MSKCFQKWAWLHVRNRRREGFGLVFVLILLGVFDLLLLGAELLATEDFSFAVIALGKW